MKDSMRKQLAFQQAKICMEKAKAFDILKSYSGFKIWFSRSEDCFTKEDYEILKRWIK